MMDGQRWSVPTDAVLAKVEEQRNSLLTENATLSVLVDQLTAERDQLAVDLEKLRPDAAS
jgi:peptidoglycan hydrolase CwlO-like protein